MADIPTLEILWVATLLLWTLGTVCSLWVLFTDIVALDAGHCAAHGSPQRQFFVALFWPAFFAASCFRWIKPIWLVSVERISRARRRIKYNKWGPPYG